MLAHKIQRHLLSHFQRHKPRFFGAVGLVQHLSGAQAVVLWLIIADLRQRRRLPSPGVVDQQLCANAEELVELLFVVKRPIRTFGAERDIAHRVDAELLQPVRRAPPNTPEIRDRAVVPERLAKMLLIEHRQPRALGVSRHALGENIHRHLCQKEIGAHASRRRDACLCVHPIHEKTRQLPRFHVIRPQIRRHIDENLVHRIRDHILRRNIAQVNAVDLQAHFHIARHARRRHDRLQRQARIFVQFLRICRRAGKRRPRLRFSPGVDLCDSAIHLEQSRPPANAHRLQARRHRQTDRLVRARRIRHDQMGRQRIQPFVHTFHRRIE